MPKDHVKLFDIISPIYGWFFNSQVEYYKKVLVILKEHIDLRNYIKFLDVGCGTGALCYVLREAGFEVSGVEVSAGMLAQAMKRLKNTDIKAYKINPGEGFPFEDNFFDVVTASYVAHGIKKNEREILYKEMSRVAKHYVILHDYNQNRDFFTSCVEWLEGGDYFNFVKEVKKELKENFKEVKMVDISSKASLYILQPNK
ncbi:SAM-dependent methyltransferase [Thermoanaerobacter sp. YS13]|uniref:class I SAM-dependent methyltransferase n=1 Tax=Thermoanaerobacter sp. YS13 TaxID=1511746 RepID=UPI000573737F|nr:class I SAM-dependent methyltransferase [Thermoanaerobacter sp. YS13]KHO61114.1 SAM-dependent methyltransferase [Thermoanaerobacter sp. YS13]